MQDLTSVITALALTGKFSISFTFNAICIVTAEVKTKKMIKEIKIINNFNFKELSDRNTKHGHFVLFGFFESWRRHSTLYSIISKKFKACLSISIQYLFIFVIKRQVYIGIHCRS